MKKLLYITSITSPYKVKFFNELQEKCELTVIYEVSTTKNRDKKWLISTEKKHREIIMAENDNESPVKIGYKILKYVLKNYGNFDEIILGCCNSRAEMMVYIAMMFKGIKFSMNIEGETFFNDHGIKLILKKLFIKGASKFYVAGEKALESTKKMIGKANAPYIPYYFSSLTDKEIKENTKKSRVRKEFILVVAQYEYCKGLDIVLDIAKSMPERRFKFVGMNAKTEQFKKLVDEKQVDNVEIISFMTSKELENQYLSCKCLVLPSRRECWGLVINEAASYGTPIISTYGSGAAVEFLENEYSELLAEPDNVSSLKNILKCFLDKDDLYIKKYSEYLINKNFNYSIEKMVLTHAKD